MPREVVSYSMYRICRVETPILILSIIWQFACLLSMALNITKGRMTKNGQSKLYSSSLNLLSYWCHLFIYCRRCCQLPPIIFLSSVYQHTLRLCVKTLILVHIAFYTYTIPNNDWLTNKQTQQDSSQRWIVVGPNAPNDSKPEMLHFETINPEILLDHLLIYPWIDLH